MMRIFLAFGVTLTTLNSYLCFMPTLAIFASGTGSNAKNIIEKFQQHPRIKVGLLVCNKAGAGVIDIANAAQVPVLMIEKDRFFSGDAYLPVLLENKIDFIVLAGFLWKVPVTLISSFKNRIINIHPALLPKFGGKGMYGRKVHETVISQREKESGISIHFVDEIFDNGEVIFRATCPVLENDSPETLAARVHELEYANYPRVIEEVVNLQIPS